MSRRRAELVLWGVSLAGVIVTTERLRTHSPARDTTPVRARPIAGAMRRYDEDLLLTAADSIASNDPFRFGPASLGLASDVPPPPAAPAPAIPRPSLTLGGIMGGPPWRAIIAGVPGRAGSIVVNTGDTIGALHVRSVRRDAVIVDGQDTTWTLTAR